MRRFQFRSVVQLTFGMALMFCFCLRAEAAPADHVISNERYRIAVSSKLDPNAMIK